MEARAAAGLRHPHIVEVYDYGEATDEAGQARPYVVMELVEGPTLDDLLKDRALPWDAATRICAQVASALAAAHARGVVHRDVKPGNVMVTPDGVKLVDFGISAAAGAVDESHGEVLGTPAYLAPERLDGGPVRVATDVYALGLLLYRALAGRMPWTGSTVTQMVGNHLYTDPAPLPRIAGLPPRVADLVRRCLAKRPENRPSAAEAARILGEAVGLPAPEPLTLLHAESPLDRPTVAIKPPRSRRPRRSALLVAAAVAVLAMVSSFTWWPSDAPRSAQAEAATPPFTTGTPAPGPSGTAPGPKPSDRPVQRRTPPAEPVAASVKGKAGLGARKAQAPTTKRKSDDKGKADDKGKGDDKGKSDNKGKSDSKSKDHNQGKGAGKGKSKG
jgi:serine/threonine-protein kinase